MAEKEKPAPRPVEKNIEITLAGQIAAGLLAGPNVSHREPAVVAGLAVAHARAIINAVDRENA